MVHLFSICFSAIQRIEGYDRLIVKWSWGVLAIIAFMILLASWRLSVQFIRWWQKPTTSPKSLFKQLVRLHRLSAKEKVLISELAPKLPLGVPVSILFVDPSSWAWKQMQDPNAIEMLEKLYVKIFGFPRDRFET